MDKKRQQVALALKVLSQHPLIKAKKITPGEIKNWIVGTHKVEPERLIWHAKRTMKIGGSEIFAAVAFLRSVKNAANDTPESEFVMQSVQDVVSGKIFAKTPTEPDSHMRRGILSEPLARRVYIENLQKMGKTVTKDEKASAALRKFKSEKYPWLAYNEDDILIIDGVRTLIDYKCPAPDPIKGLDLKVEEAYVHQLHLGAYCLRELGYAPEKLHLVKYNVVEATCIEIPVQINETLISENLEAGTYLYDNYILNRRLPEYQPTLLTPKSLSDISKDLNELYGHLDGAPDAATKNLMVMLNKFAIAKTMNQASAQQLSTLSGQIKDFFVASGVITDNSVLCVGPVEVKLTNQKIIDEELVLAEAEKLDIDISQHTKKVTYNFDQIYSEILKVNPDFKAVTEVQEQSVVVTRKQQGTAAMLKSKLVENAEIVIDEMLKVTEQTGLFEQIEDKVNADVMQLRSKQAYFRGKWQDAIQTYIDYTNESESKTINELANDLLGEDAKISSNKPF